MTVKDIYENLKANKANLNDLLKSIQERIGTTENWEEVTLDRMVNDYTLRTLYDEYKIKEKQIDDCVNQPVENVTLPPVCKIV